MLSNGPGDPKECTTIIEEIRKLYESDVPISSTLVTLKTESDNTAAETPINVKLEPVEQYIAVSKKCHRSLK